MRLGEYFESAKGLGVLATSDAEGKVDVAVYARPHLVDEETVAFIMADRLSHKNVQSNPHAAYLFVEEGGGYVGKRLYLTRIKEETDSARIQSLRRRKVPSACQGSDKEKKHLVYFRIERVRSLIGDNEETP